MKKFLNIEGAYRFEMNDLRTIIQIINVALIMIFGLSVSWFGLTVALCGIIKDFRNPHRHLNDFLIHGATAILNTYFLCLLYFGA